MMSSRQSRSSLAIWLGFLVGALAGWLLWKELMQRERGREEAGEMSLPEEAPAAEGETADARALPPESRRPKAKERTCPQKLARIHGIGRVFEDRLYEAGIGTFWQVATTPVRDLAAILGIKDFQAVDVEGIREEARRLAEETDSVGEVWSGRKPDDFEMLPGMGKTYETRLYEAGICTWEQLASMHPEELAAIVQAPAWNQPDYALWIQLARQHLASR
jgi:predicted flap endonuclease-1-like 5' DNA nuclease